MDLTPFIHSYIIPLLELLGAGFALWLTAMTASWLSAHAKFLGADRIEKITALENQAVQAGVDYVVAYAEREGKLVHPQANSWLLRQGAQVALDHATGILADNGASPSDVANKILAKLPAAYVTTDAIKAVPTPIAVTVAELAPIPMHSTPQIIPHAF